MRPAVGVGDFSFLPFAVEIVIAFPNGYVLERIDVHDHHSKPIDTQTFDGVEERDAESLKRGR